LAQNSRSRRDGWKIRMAVPHKNLFSENGVFLCSFTDVLITARYWASTVWATGVIYWGARGTGTRPVAKGRILGVKPQWDYLERGTEKYGTISLVQMHQNVSFQHENPTNYSLLLWYCLYSFICTKFSKLILWKIVKIVAKRQILSPKCTKFDVGWDSAPDPTGGAYSAPQTP